MSLKGRVFSWFSLLWLTLIWTLSSLPSKSIPPVGDWGVDKIAHFLIYIVLTIWVNKAILNSKFDLGTAHKIYVVLIVSAMLDEAHQVFVPGRSVSIYDFAANASGLVSGYAWLRWQFRNRGSKGL